jgi:WD40 repeat protein
MRRNDSQRPKAVFAKAGNRFQERRQAEAVSELQLAASELAELGVGSDPQAFQWHEVNMNLTKDRVDAVRFKIPEGGPVDLLWTVVFPPNLRDCQITPVAGDLADAQVRYLSVYPDQQTREITVARVLEGPSLKSGQEFLMWLSFRDENVAKVSICLTVFPAGKIREQGWSWVPTDTPELEEVPVLRRTRLCFHGAPVIGIALAPDGKTLASAGTDNIVKLWDVEAAKVMATCSGYMPTFSPDGKVLATAGTGEDSINISLWDTKTAQKIRTLTGGHFLTVTAISFSADGKRLASGGRDGWITLWDPVTGRQAW